MTGLNEKPKAALALRSKTNLVHSPVKQLKRKLNDQENDIPSKAQKRPLLLSTEKKPTSFGSFDPVMKENEKQSKSGDEKPKIAIESDSVEPIINIRMSKEQPARTEKAVNDDKSTKDEKTIEKLSQEKTTKPNESKNLEKQKREEEIKAENARLEKEEMEQLMKDLPYLCEYYELKEKIGRGTFSTVYKALDVQRDLYDNDDWLKNIFAKPYTGEDKSKHLNDIKTLSEFVALKRVYSTSSPQRIANEIKILKQLKGTTCISPLITAFRDGDDTFVVMPYYQHDDFNDIYSTMSCNDIKCYLKSLFTALSQLHSLKIIHKDVKPNNFLYNSKKRVGYLIDFGLAQREDETKHFEEKTVSVDDLPLLEPIKGYDTRDPRKQVRANRAGTRGYRAPEVLLRVVHQTTAVDIWSVGTILLSLLTRVFPFFVGFDEADSIVEVANVFGFNTLQKMALKYNRIVHSNICGLPKEKVSLKKLCAYYNSDELRKWPEKDVRGALNLLERCLLLDPTERITAEEALGHPFLHFD